MDSDNYYFEHTIKLEENSYLKLLDMYFKPKTFFDDVEKTLDENQKKELNGESLFDKIFPENAEYLDNHRDLENRQAFLAWNGWCFRGHEKSSWKLKTKFERLCFYKPIMKKRDLFEIENGMMRDFQRRIQQYVPAPASITVNDIYMLLANMQHYGCATRFLDMSFSFFVALFFACGYLNFDDIVLQKKNTDDNTEDANGNEMPSSEQKRTKPHSFSIYCFNRMWIEKTYKMHLPKEIAEMYKSDEFGKAPETQHAVWNYVKKHSSCFPEVKKESVFNSVINMTPYYINMRLDRQKGSFLMPTNPYCTFEENLKSLVDKDPNGKFRVLKINVEYDNNMLLYYQKFLDEMNINHAVLFDDVENMCEHINYKTRLPNDALITPKKGM